MFWQTTLVASLLASGAQAGIGGLIVEGMTRNSPAVERRLQEIAKSSILARGYVESRQAATQPNILNPDGTMNVAAWDAAANEACQTALRELPQASNPSGTCVCYNLPALNNVTGRFDADLRLFRRGEPTGDFLGIPPQNVQVGLSYRGASVSPVSMGRAASPAASSSVAAGTSTLSTRQAQINPNETLELLQTYLFVGQIDRDQMRPGMTMAELQALVMPVLTLSATNSQGRQVSTNVSSNEAAFVTGVFSQEIVMSPFRLAELAVDEEIARLRNGTSAFQLPGVQIMIFPIGLIITSLWTVIGVGAYALGTYNRYNFREQYRRRIQRVEKSAVATF
ncbi:hypothetical protein B0T16DRAFT_461513 [Cercophora newfieldiana]|uniref:Uncharacterized protein n=1 Tax=Cercophora newfieldiana TaxID=92897 RepID=A0AA40CK70_9PEZI|nr:hypothetical protein B0T16DRAFT_461513 [Cercophora newfieldiana]